MGIGLSFTDWSIYSEELHFVGLKNIQTVFSSDYNYTHALMNTLKFTVVTTLVKNVLGLALAVLMTKQVKLLNFHRAVLYLPCVLSALIVGMIFKSVLNPRDGLLNRTLRALGLDFMALKWLTDSKIAFNSVMAVDIWKGMGYIMTILIAGIMSISPVYYEAARIEGCSEFRIMWQIAVPLTVPTIATLALFYAVSRWNGIEDQIYYINSSNLYTVQMTLKQMIESIAISAEEGSNTQMTPENVKAASITLSMLPMLIVYPFVQRFFTQGIMLGAVKG
jgi:raffinose/stachyose/melibiose transport system permease protein